MAGRKREARLRADVPAFHVLIIERKGVTAPETLVGAVVPGCFAMAPVSKCFIRLTCPLFFSLEPQAT